MALLLTTLAACLLYAPTGATASERPTRWEHELRRLWTARELARGAQFERAERGERGIDLHPVADAHAAWTSAPIEFAAPFSELLPSWNVTVPPGTGITVELSVRDEEGDSPWLYVGSWGSLPASLSRESECASGRIDIDYFRASRPCTAARVRLLAFAAAGRDDVPASVTLRRLTLCASRGDESTASPRAPRLSEVRLDVPFRSQHSENAAIAGRICSPTSIAMVLAYRGVERTTLEVAQTVYDPEHDIYGNWPRAVQGAYSLGVAGYLTRFADWREVGSALASGQPLVCSIGVAAGELPGAPYTSTAGHLIVLCGFDERGDCLVNDPAAADETSVRRTYRRADLERVWLRRGGTAYVFLARGAAD